MKGIKKLKTYCANSTKNAQSSNVILNTQLKMGRFFKNARGKTIGCKETKEKTKNDQKKVTQTKIQTQKIYDNGGNKLCWHKFQMEVI